MFVKGEKSNRQRVHPMSCGHLLAIHDSEAMAPVAVAAVEPIAVDLAAVGLVAVVLNTSKLK